MADHRRSFRLPDWQELVSMPEDELARVDIAAANLACAVGLPGSEAIDFNRCWDWLDRATKLVKRWTDLGREEFFLQNPGEYKNSEAYFRVLGLASVLQRHCGVRYDPSKLGAGPEVPFGFDEMFIHGVIQGPGGTCATLPVVYASIGRRLGYPIKLVCTVRHLFARWDDAAMGERFNIECACEGFDDPPDDRYREWPEKIKGPDHERAYGYLESFTPRQELANFIGQRAFALRDSKRFREGVEAFAVAARLTPQHATYPGCILGMLVEWKKHLQAQFPPRFPKRIVVDLRPAQARWPWMPWEVEREVASLHATEWCLTYPPHEKWWWGPLRQNRPPLRDVPTSISLDYDVLLRNT